MLATVSRFMPIHMADFGDFGSESPILAIQTMKSPITISDSKKIGVHESDRRIGDSRDFNAILVTMVILMPEDFMVYWLSDLKVYLICHFILKRYYVHLSD